MTVTDFFEKAALAVHILMVGAIVMGLVKVKSRTGDQLLLLSLIIISGLVELIGRMLWQKSMNNLFLYHFYTIIEFLLLGALYARNLAGLIKPFYMKVLIAAFVMFAVANTIFFQSLKEFNSNVTFVESLLLIVLSLAYFYKLLRDMNHRKLERVPMFWINMSVLTYFSGALLLFHVTNELFTFPKEEIAMLFSTHALFNIVHYLLYGIALWVKPETFTPNPLASPKGT